MYSNYPLNEKVDVWSLAVVLYNMMYFKMPFSSSDKVNQIEGLVSFPQTDKYSIQLQRLLKRLFEPNPKNRPSMSEVFRFVENLQAKCLVTKPEQPKSKRKFSGFEESKKVDSYSSEEDTKKYKTAQDLEDTEDINYGKAQLMDNSEKNFTGFATKVSATLAKNGTKGWILYATENSNFPPRIQYISKLVLKGWRKPDKIYKFYKNLRHRGFEHNTIIALK